MYPLQYTNIEKRQKPWDTIPKLTVTIAGINPENMGVLLLLYFHYLSLLELMGCQEPGS
jgi:hypothetical protein